MIKLLLGLQFFVGGIGPLAAPEGYDLVAWNPHDGRGRLIAAIDPSTLPQARILVTKDEDKIAGSQGGGTASFDGRDVIGYVVIRSDGRIFNPYPARMTCDVACGRVELFRRNDGTTSERPFASFYKLEAEGKFGFPGETGWPRLMPSHYAFQFQDDGFGLITRPCTLVEHARLFWQAGW